MMPLCNHYLWMKMAWTKGSLNHLLRRRDVMIIKVKTLLQTLRWRRKEKEKDVEPSNKSSTSKESSKCKTLPKSSKTGKSVTTEESVEELVQEVAMEVEEPIRDDVVNDVDQPRDDVDPKKDNSTWFTQHTRPETHDPEGNKDKNIDDRLEQTWFNDLVNAEKDSLTFDELMATLMDFTNIELEYNMDQCYNALTNQLDWTDPEGDRCPYDLSKPLPLQGSPVRIADQKLYMFKKGDFPKLHLNDIEDMLLLHVQNKLFNLDGNDIVDLAVPL
ncbi:hypothetical protein Tco_0725502, partial [Tanacetum coccineum]